MAELYQNLLFSENPMTEMFCSIGMKSYRLFLPVFLLLMAPLFAGTTFASNPTNGLRIEIMSAYNLVVDSNVESPSTYAPRAAFFGAKFCNDGDTPLNNIYANIGTYSNRTPGIYPRRQHMALDGFGADNAFYLVHEGGSMGTLDATRFLGTLQPGECKMVYWLVGYPNLDESGHAVWGPSVKPDDDLWLTYDIWATSTRTGAVVTANASHTVTMRNEISAMANKIYPNGANKVPQEYLDLLQIYQPLWTNAFYDGSVGTHIVTEGIWYDLGNVGYGFDNNGDLVPDQNAWLQPVGDPGMFDSACFRLVHTYSMVVVKLRTGEDRVYIGDDQLYFMNIPGDNNGAVGYVGYEFEVLNANCVSTLSPYQEVASGYDNEKFNGDYGATLGQLTSGQAHLTLDKAANRPTASPGDTISYNVAFTNTGTVQIGDPYSGNPIVVTEHIPHGVLYVPLSAGSSNTLPSGVTGYTILFSTNNGTSWQTNEPAAGTITDIQWWLSDSLAGGAGGAVNLQVTINNPYTNTDPRISNESCVSMGNTTAFLCDDTNTFVLGTNRLGDTVWKDDGAGGGTMANQVQDGSEAGIPNISVYLYYDVNANGVQDGSDIYYGSQVTSATGYYLFTNLLDGRYVAVVDNNDTDLPYGYTLSTPSSYGADLDSAHATTNPVSFLTADYGYVPALGLDKDLIGTNYVYEGRTVQFKLTVTNNIPGNGTTNGGPLTYVTWFTNIDVVHSGVRANEQWAYIPNAYSPPYPDENYAWSPLKNAEEFIALCGLNLSSNAGSVTNVQLVLITRTNGNAAAAATISLMNNGAVFWTCVTNESVWRNGEVAFNVTSVSNWTWASFNNTNIEVLLDDKKAGNPGGSNGLDIAGFRIQSDKSSLGAIGTTTINPAPMFDTFDPRRMQYVSATPQFPDSLRTNGTPTNPIARLDWNNVGPLYPGGSRTFYVNFMVTEPSNNIATWFTNTVSITNAYFIGGKHANSATDSVPVYIQPAGSIGDYIWRDINRDGIQNETNAGIPNVKVVCNPPTNVDIGAGLGVAITNITDVNGYYLFAGIPSTGRYTVVVLTNTLPIASAITWSNTFDEDGLKNNQTIVSNLNPTATNGLDKHLTADWGYWLGSSIDGLVWHDANRSATSNRDAGEDWITGVRVFLYSITNTVTPIATNYTDNNGYFLFTGSYSGQYVVVVSTNYGPMTNQTWIQTFDSDGTNTRHQVTVTVPYGGTAHADYSYYYYGPYAIGDTVYYDWNGNGTQDANDEGMYGIPVYLWEDANSNGTRDVGIDAYIGTRYTDTNGYYIFTGLPTSNYLVIVDQAATNFPPLYTCTADPYGAKDGRSQLYLTATNLLQDFGYQPYGYGTIGDTVWFDSNGNGTQNAGEAGISNISVWLYADLNNDGRYTLVNSNNTSSTGYYIFTNLPDGHYRVLVDTADTNLPHDAFGYLAQPTTATNFNVTITNASTFLDADFGFVLPGAIGDTIFWDANRNGIQDYNEPGVTGVTVMLYHDLNTNGIYDAGDTYAGSRVTTNSGLYLFRGLMPDHYVVVVSNSGPLTGSSIMSDPNSDGRPCTDPAVTNPCDGEVGVNINYGTSFMGADFGYVPPGTIGDLVWIDSNSNGLRDDGENGIPYITMLLYTNGTLIATNVTDSDGYYLFTGLPDGTYKVVVATNDSDFPFGLSRTYDYDGLLDDQTTNIIISSTNMVTHTVIHIGGIDCTECFTNVDFGYRYAGTNYLSGTVGMDGLPYNGMMGTGTSGYSSNEIPFEGVQVFLKIWNDANSNGIIEASESHSVATTMTDTNGDYSFSMLPTYAGPGTNRYIVSLTAPEDFIKLTTTVTSGVPSVAVVETVDTLGNTISAYQIVPIAPSQVNVDFAFRETQQYDFGDLPESYSTLLQDNPVGADHIVKVTTNLYLGATVDTEVNGQPSVDALGDGADEDAVTLLGYMWKAGDTNGTIVVKVGRGSGWLVGYIDFNGDGSFNDAEDMIINKAVSTNGSNGTGLYTNNFTVPADAAIQSSTSSVFYSRFRLMASEPSFPQLAYAAGVDNGEVEDWRWLLGSVGNYVWNDQNGDGVIQAGEEPFRNVRVFADRNTNGVYDSATDPSALTDSAGYYYIGGFMTNNYPILVDTSTLPSRATPTYDLDGTNTANKAIVGMTTMGQLRTDADFGYRFPESDLGVTKTVSDEFPGTNEIVFFTVVVTNNGVEVANDVIFTDYWPTNYVTYLSYSASQGSYTVITPTNHEWHFGPVNVGGSVTLWLTGQMNAAYLGVGVRITNQVRLTYVDYYDTNPINNTSKVPLATLVVVGRFDPFTDGSRCGVEWETVSESGTAGFLIDRREAGAGEFVRVTENLLPTEPDVPQGSVYRWVDPTAEPGRTYEYKLVEVEVGGAVLEYGPYTVVMPASTTVKKTTLSRTMSTEPAVETFSAIPRASSLREERLADAATQVVSTRKLTMSAAGGDGGASAQGEPDAIKLAITNNGLYFVSADSLAAMAGVGSDVIASRITNGLVRIANHGLDCAWMPAANGAGLYFYGQAADSKFTDQNLYWLTWELGHQIETRNVGEPTGASSPAWFDTTVHFEQDRKVVTSITRDPDYDYWFWDSLVAGNAQSGTRNLGFSISGLNAGVGQPVLSIRIQGATTVGKPNEHHIRVALNGTVLGEATWQGLASWAFEFPVGTDVLREGSNTVTVTGILNSGISYSTTYIDSFDLTYPRRYQALDGQLLCSGDSGSIVSVPGFDSSAIQVFDVSDPLNPASCAGARAAQAEEGYQVDFTPEGASIPYLVWSPDGALTPAGMSAFYSTGLKDSANEGDYVIITVPAMAAVANTLASYREGIGMKSKVILLSDIYDEFGYGESNPAAIRTFLGYALTHWARPPVYVLLAGEGTYDYKNRYGYGDNLIPTYMTETPQGLYGSDNWYADVNGDRMPDLAIGRLPALTADELQRMVDRTIAYEEALGSDWSKRVILVDDNTDNGGDFKQSNRGISGRFPSDYTIQQISLNDKSVSSARTSLIKQLNSGSLIANYFGHGGTDRWATEGLLTIADVTPLSNANRLPVVVAMGCVMGQFCIPGYDSLAEAFMLSKTGGAVAVWSPTGSSFNEPATVLCDGFYRAIYEEGMGVLGEAMLKAIDGYVAQRRTAYIPELYNLLGDPALRIKDTPDFGASKYLELWKDRNFSSQDLNDTSVSGDTADPDADGQVNMAEYAFGGNPNVADSNNGQNGLKVDNAADGGGDTVEIILKYNRRKAVRDMDYVLQMSPDMTQWQDATSCVVDSAVASDAALETEAVTLHVRFPAGYDQSRGYLKMSVRQKGGTPRAPNSLMIQTSTSGN